MDNIYRYGSIIRKEMEWRNKNEFNHEIPVILDHAGDSFTNNETVLKVKSFAGKLQAVRIYGLRRKNHVPITVAIFHFEDFLLIVDHFQAGYKGTGAIGMLISLRGAGVSGKSNLIDFIMGDSEDAKMLREKSCLVEILPSGYYSLEPYDWKLDDIVGGAK